MAPSSIPPHLVQYLVSPQTTEARAVDALEEWILTRRAKGETLFEISVGLAELEDKTPPHVCAAFDRARYVTNVPQPSDLTPPMGPFPLARSQSPATILSHLLSQPPPSLEHSREVILEYILAREGKMREKKYGRGGKGTLGRDSFEDLSKRLSEVEDGLRATATSPRGGPSDLGTSLFSGTRRISVGGLDEARQLGLTLILSLRMSLSYFTLQELADQLLSLAVGDAEKTLVQHIRRRVAGEGRWGVGKELEYVEGLVCTRRPALRPAFRSAKNRTYLSAQPNYPISLPAPSKSACIKLLTTFVREVEVGGKPAISAFTQPSFASISPTSFSPGSNDTKSYFLSRRGTTSPGTPSLMMSVSPKGPMSSLSPSPALPVTPSFNPAYDPNPLASYAMELVSEFLMREKREWMMKSKWAKTGREQLGKDLGDIESAVCLSNKNTASPSAQTLLPVFLLLRRTLTLPPSPLPPSIVEPYLDILPAPPDPDEVPFREPTMQTTTASLYVNPRLADAAALEVLEELLENERESVEAAGATREQTANWLIGQIESVEKRFPDGSYSEVFAFLRRRTDPSDAPSGDVAHQQQSSVSFAKQPSLHRRSRSNGTRESDEPDGQAIALAPLTGPTRLQYTRSISMPTRSSSHLQSERDNSNEEIVSPQVTRPRPTDLMTRQKPELVPLNLLTASHVGDSSKRESTQSASSGGRGWWDVVSAVENESPPPWQQQNPRASPRNRASSSSTNGILTLPPGAEAAQVIDPATPYHELTGLDLSASPPVSPRRAIVQPSPGRSIPIKRPSVSPRPTPATPERHESPRKSPDLHEVSRSAPRPIPLSFNPIRPSFPPGRVSDSQPSPAPQPGEIISPSGPTKSKLGGFGRSVSVAGKSMMSRNKDKENENLAVSGSKEKDKVDRKGSVQNAPGKWNKDMVADIMGPPAGKR